jgi:hypothetical protein
LKPKQLLINQHDAFNLGVNAQVQTNEKEKEFYRI